MISEVRTAQLVEAASAGDTEAWRQIVHRHARLVQSVCRRFRLSDEDAQDVSQTVWLRLVERLDRLRDPQALAGWLLTTTRNECIAVWRASRRQLPIPMDAMPGFASYDEVDDAELDRDLLIAERHDALREAFAQLPQPCRRLLAMLFGDPPVPYAEISRQLGVPRGYIGPTRARCLHKLRECPALVAYLQFETELSPERR